MSREIRFRAWDKFKDVPDMVYFDLDILQEGKTVLIGSIVDTELMQYTGLKDKNGKEAYEGDIYTCGYRYSDGTHKYGDKNLIDDIRTFNPEDSFEIVGNQYQNPELLSSDNK